MIILTYYFQNPKCKFITINGTFSLCTKVIKVNFMTNNNEFN